MPLPPAREQERNLEEADPLKTRSASATYDTRLGRERFARLRRPIVQGLRGAARRRRFHRSEWPRTIGATLVECHPIPHLTP